MGSSREESPFASLRKQDVERMLASSSELGIALQQAMHAEHNSFCDEHDDQGTASMTAWRLHAALLNEMLQPLVQIFKRASDAAVEALYPSGTGELELAFRGEARDAYVWLQCMLTEELRWCTTIGCPTCSTAHILSSETTIRAAMTAALYSAYANTLSSPTANFRPILGTLRTAISADSFWTPHHYPHFLARSQSLADGVRDLHIQVLEMEILLSSPPSSDSSNDSVSSYVEQRDSPKSLIRIRPSKLAKRQMRLREEEGLVSASMVRRFTEAEAQRDTRMVADKKVRRKRSGNGLVRSKSSTMLI